MLSIKQIIFVLFVVSAISPTILHAKTFSQYLCESEYYDCVIVKKKQTWKTLFPNDTERGIVMRVNRLNIELYPGQKIAIPKNLANSTIMDFSPFPLQIPAPQEKVIVVDPALLAWGAYDAQGTLVRWGPVAAGAAWCHDTQKPCHTTEGMYRITRGGDSDCYSSKFPLPSGGAPMPYCMYFNGGQALHGEPNGLPGYNASHGCVRTYVSDAEWMRNNFIEVQNVKNKILGTRVIVKDYK